MALKGHVWTDGPEQAGVSCAPVAEHTCLCINSFCGTVSKYRTETTGSRNACVLHGFKEFQSIMVRRAWQSLQQPGGGGDDGRGRTHGDGDTTLKHSIIPSTTWGIYNGRAQKVESEASIESLGLVRRVNQVKALATTPGDLSLISKNHVVDEESQFPQVALRPPHMPPWCAYALSQNK